MVILLLCIYDSWVPDSLQRVHGETPPEFSVPDSDLADTESTGSCAMGNTGQNAALCCLLKVDLS